MLENAQTFQATTNATFKSNVRLTSSQFTLNWEESVNATGGWSG
jgi:hypothetical protein